MKTIEVVAAIIHKNGRILAAQRGYGDYIRLDPSLLPPVYVAYRTDLSEVSGVYHNNLKARYNAGDPAVVGAMKFWADITEEARGCLERHDYKRLSELMDQNFDKRVEVSQVSPDNLRMVKTARACGASAKFTGSGGAIVGLYDGEEMLRTLETELAKISVKVLRPTLAPFSE